MKVINELDGLTLFKLLSDETRLAVVLLLVKQQELCVCEFMQALELSQPKISRHLAMLREAQLLLTRRSGKWVYYSLNRALPVQVHDILSQALVLEAHNIVSLEDKLQVMGERPERINQCC